MHNIPPDQAILIVRRDRPGSVQTSAQAKFVRSFHEYINASKVVFALPFIHDRFSVGEMIEHQNRMVHGEKTSGARLALPKVLDFLCGEVEKAADSQPAQMIHAFINHIPFPQIDGKVVGDFPGIQESHIKGIFEGNTTENDETGRASSFFSAANPGALSSTPPPPVPSFSLSSSTRHISQEELFPIKVAFNVGESNWQEVSELCTTVSLYPVLLLDWLEHLVEPILDADVPDAVLGQVGDSDTIKCSKALHRLPISVNRSLDRLLSCLRVLQRKITLIEGGSVGTSFAHGVSNVALFDAVCSRAAMAVFHVSNSTNASLTKYADFMAMLVRDWHAPKRLELNLESLQKLGKASSARKLSHSGSKIIEHTPTSPRSPRVGEHHASFEPVHPRPAAPGEHFPKPRENHDPSSFVKIEPLHLHSRLPSEQGASPVKLEMPLTPHLSPEKRKEPIIASSLSALSTSPTKSVSFREKDSEITCSASATSPTSSAGGLTSSSSACSLPSVRGGDRYKNKHG